MFAKIVGENFMMALEGRVDGMCNGP